MAESNRVTRRHMIAAGAIPFAELALAQSTSQPVKTPPQMAETEQQSGPPPAPLPPDQRVGFAIVGLGKLAIEEVLPAFGQCKKAKPAALVTGSAEKGSIVAAQYGLPPDAIYSYDQFDRLGKNSAVQVVYVITPDSLHREHTLKALQAGKHVLCEKPMATSVRACEEMIQAAEKARRKLMIAYRIQYEPYNRMARQLVRSQKFGPTRLIDAVNTQRQGDPSQWRLKRELSGTGPLADIGLYCINTTRFLLGEEPSEICAMLRSDSKDPRFREVEESFVWNMRFPSGVLAIMMCGYDEHQVQRYQVYSPLGSLELDPAFAYRGLKMRSTRADGKSEREEQVKLEDKNQFALEMDHFADCVLQDRKPFTPGEEGLQDQRIIEAVYPAAKSGRMVKMEAGGKLDRFRGHEPEEAS